MGWPFGSRASQITASDLLGWRTADRSTPRRSLQREDALRQSAAWACLRLRADLVSTMPIDVYRRVNGVQVEVPPSPVLQSPGGSSCDRLEWMYSTQFDLDSCGNDFGIIKARDGLGLPAVIELVPATDVSVQVRNKVVKYRFGGEDMDPLNVWHERQYTTSGVPVGMSPIAYAAASILGYLEAQSFAADWFSGSGFPAAILKNGQRTIDEDEARKTKARFKASVTNGDVFVTGKDWDYSMVAAKASEAAFLDQLNYGLADTCRFLGVPADMIDAEPNSNSGGGKLVYANITQRNLQLLIMNLGPTILRREHAFSTRLLQQPRYVKFNTDSLLRMDLKSRYEGYKIAIDSRHLAPSEARELENRPPFTPAQLDEFATLFPAKAASPTAPSPGVPA